MDFVQFKKAKILINSKVFCLCLRLQELQKKYLVFCHLQIQLFSFIMVLKTIIQGKFRNLSQRLVNAQMEFSNPDSSRVLNFTLMNRVMIWKVYEMFLKHILPHAHGFLSDSLKNIFYLHSYLGIGNQSKNVLNCVFCGQRPTMVMQAIPCTHKACFYCAKSSSDQSQQAQKCKHCGIQVQKWRKLF